MLFLALAHCPTPPIGAITVYVEASEIQLSEVRKVYPNAFSCVLNRPGYPDEFLRPVTFHQIATVSQPKDLSIIEQKLRDNGIILDIQTGGHYVQSH